MIGSVKRRGNMRDTGFMRLAGPLVAGLLAVTITGCPKGEPAGNSAPAGGGGGPSGKRLTIAVIPKGTKHQFWQAVNAGAQKAATEENVEAQWGAPPNEDS